MPCAHRFIVGLVQALVVPLPTSQLGQLIGLVQKLALVLSVLVSHSQC
jgi:hypothetical protein